MRKPLNTSVPEDLIAKIDDLVSDSKGAYSNRSHFVEQAVKSYLGDDLSLFGGLLPKTGGPGPETAAASSLYETSTYPRLSKNVAEKLSIAEKAIELVSVDHVLFLDGSTTCIVFAKILSRHAKNLTVVTNSTLVCLELSKNSSIKVIGIGGELDSSTASFTGRDCEESVEKLYFDAVFVSTKGFLPEDGTYESNMATLRVKQIAARRGRRLVLLTDHTKFNQRSLCKVLDTSQIHAVVTDAGAPADALEVLRSRGREVLVAEVRAP
jgi:DeoR/GlpR family transcriptional regulator of sugar metabolism